MVTGGPVAHRASRNSFVAAFSYGGCFCGRILRRMLSRHQPHRLHYIKLCAGHCPRRKRALPQDDGLPLLSVTAFVTGQQWCLCSGCVVLAAQPGQAPRQQAAAGKLWFVTHVSAEEAMASAFVPNTWLSRYGSTVQLGTVKMRTRLLC